MHQRIVIRRAVVAALTGATAAGSRVKATRVEPNRAAGLPAIAVYTPSDETDPEDATTAPRELWRNLVLKVTGWVSDTAAVPVDDAMDALAEQIEAAMDVDRYLGGAASNSILTTTETGVLDDGDPLVGVVTLTYQVTYFTSPAFAGGNQADYLRTDAKTQIVGAGADNAVDELFNQRT